MLHTIRLPALGQIIEEAKAVEWLVDSGDVVEKDEPVLMVETDKSVLEVNSDLGGRFQRRIVEIGAIVRVGDPIAEIET